MALNVKPVTGSTPAELALELRHLVKSDIYPKLISKSFVSNAKKEMDLALILLVELDNDMTTLQEIATRRRPSETRNKIDDMREQGLFALRTRFRNTKDFLSTDLDNTVSSENAKRLYALVQALPTIEKAPVGKAENTVRALTAIIKVHFGLSVDDGPEALPDVLAEMLKLIGQAKEPVVEEVHETPIYSEISSDETPIYSEISSDEKVPQIFTIYNEEEEPLDVDNMWFSDIPKFGLEADGVGSLAGWANGTCDLEEALETLVALRNSYSDLYFELRKHGDVIAAANRSLPITIYWERIFPGPYSLGGAKTKKWADNYIVKDYGNGGNGGYGNGHFIDGYGSTSGKWLSGDCPLEVAINHMVNLRRGSPNHRIRLTDGNDVEIAHGLKGLPIVWCHPRLSVYAKEVTVFPKHVAKEVTVSLENVTSDPQEVSS